MKICDSCHKKRKDNQVTTYRVNVGRDRGIPRYYNRCKFCYMLLAYELTEERYYEFLSKQQGKCGICLEDFIDMPRISNGYPGGRSPINVDHDSKTGKVRGLLCHKCNTRLGRYNKQEWWLQRAEKYLDGKSNEVIHLVKSS